MDIVHFVLSLGSVFVAFWVFFGSLGSDTASDHKTASSGTGFESVAYLLLIPFFVLAALGVACWKMLEWLRDGAEAVWESTEERRERVSHAIRERRTRRDQAPKHLRRILVRQSSQPTDEEEQEEAGFSDEEEELLAAQHLRRAIHGARQSISRSYERMRSASTRRIDRVRRWFERRMDLEQDAALRKSIATIDDDATDRAPAMPKRVRSSRRMRLFHEADDSEESLTVLRPIGWHTRRRLRHVA